MNERTPLYQEHLRAGAKMVDFAGWDMPIHYGSVIGEHQAVRGRAGVFDVSHMTVVDLEGERALDFLRRLLANDAARLAPGGAFYSAMLNQSAGVIDDLIVYRRDGAWRLVVNCATREKDLAWMTKQAEAVQGLQLRERPDMAILAVHGPESIGLAVEALRRCGLDEAGAQGILALKNFQSLDTSGGFVARTGYTGERGVEILLPGEAAPPLWQALRALDVQPVGLGARDTLRLEAGMNLYGHDMDETVSPLSANMGRTIAWEPAERDFIGRTALEAQRADYEEGRLPRQVGLLLESRGVLREGQKLRCLGPQGEGEGVITSGSFSPTLKQSIALARVPGGTRECRVDLRGNDTPLRLVKPGFVRFGKPVVEDLQRD